MSSRIGYIHSLESMGTVDGPGIRVVVFMQGCKMRCQYCHNPDSWEMNAGTKWEVDKLFERVQLYKAFMDSSGGGLTVTGGEPTLQAHFVAELFEKCQAAGIHTCLDSNGYVRHRNATHERLIAATDLVLLDIKQMDPEKHLALTEVSNEPVLNFATYLHEIDQPVWLRYVVVNGWTDDLEDARKLAEFIAPMQNIKKVELLPYHTMGEYKWAEMDMIYPLKDHVPPKKEVLSAIADVFAEAGVQATFSAD